MGNNKGLQVNWHTIGLKVPEEVWVALQHYATNTYQLPSAAVRQLAIKGLQEAGYLNPPLPVPVSPMDHRPKPDQD